MNKPYILRNSVHIIISKYNPNKHPVFQHKGLTLLHRTAKTTVVEMRVVGCCERRSAVGIEWTDSQNRNNVAASVIQIAL